MLRIMAMVAMVTMVTMVAVPSFSFCRWRGGGVSSLASV